MLITVLRDAGCAELCDKHIEIVLRCLICKSALLQDRQRSTIHVHLLYNPTLSVSYDVVVDVCAMHGNYRDHYANA